MGEASNQHEMGESSPDKKKKKKKKEKKPKYS